MPTQSQTSQTKTNTNSGLKLEVIMEDGAHEPYYAHSTDAGMDLAAKERTVISPGTAKFVATGVYVNIPEGYFGLVVPRSGRSVKRPFVQPNSPGILDAYYQGEIMVPQRNLSEGTAEVGEGERIAQLVILQFTKANIAKLAQFTTSSERGTNGLGSTGE